MLPFTADNGKGAVKVNDSKYKVLVETLKNQILGGKYDVAKPFPSVRALIRRFGMSKTTVQRALDELFHLGLISRKQGRGTFIAGQRASRKIGLIVPGVAYSEFFPPIVNEISRLSQKEGYTLLFGAVTSQDPGVRARQAKKFAGQLIKDGVAGVIFQPLEFLSDLTEKNQEIVNLFRRANIPVVLACADFVPPPDRSGYDVIGINNVEAGAMMARHLADSGAKRICFLMRPNRGMSIRNRYRGFVMALGSEDRIRCRCDQLLAGTDDLFAVKRLLRRRRPDAFVCGSDSDAAKFKVTLEKAGLKVPDDVMLAGFNDVQMASILTPALTSVRIPCKEIAATAFYRLLARIADPDLPAMECLLPVRLVARGSTARPKRRPRNR